MLSAGHGNTCGQAGQEQSRCETVIRCHMEHCPGQFLIAPGPGLSLQQWISSPKGDRTQRSKDLSPENVRHHPRPGLSYTETKMKEKGSWLKEGKTKPLGGSVFTSCVSKGTLGTPE